MGLWCFKRWDYGISDRSAKSLADLSEAHRSAKLLADLWLSFFRSTMDIMALVLSVLSYAIMLHEKLFINMEAA